MKKKMILLIVGVFLITGCMSEEKKEEMITSPSSSTDQANVKTLKCSLEKTVDSETTLVSQYQVTYRGKYVLQLKTIETVTSDNEDTLDLYKNTMENIYDDYNDLDYYNNDIVIRGNQLISTTTADYEKVDTDKLIEIDQGNASIIEDGKVKISSLKTLYQQLGATCNEK